MFHRTAAFAASVAALALPLIGVALISGALISGAPSSAEASPKRYDIQQLLYQDMPAWRRGSRAAAPAPTRE